MILKQMLKLIRGPILLIKLWQKKKSKSLLKKWKSYKKQNNIYSCMEKALNILLRVHRAI